MTALRKIDIVGGSLAGLMSGLELAAAGADVRIYERSEREPDDRGAGIVMQPETQRMLSVHAGLREERSGVGLHYRQYLDKDGRREFHQAMPQLMTSWGLLYRTLRRAFPEARYLAGAALQSFEMDATGITAHFAGVGEQRCELLVGADGSRSFVRGVLAPEVAPRYAGYVAWRGVVPEAEADSNLLNVFDDHFTFQQMPHSHILCYLIPGPEGEITRGQRRINWVW